MIKKIITFFIILLVLSTTIFSFLFISFLIQPAARTSQEIIIVIEKGSSFTSINNKLNKESLIKNKTFFKILAKLTRVSSKIKTGEFLLRYDMTPIQILDTLVYSSPILYTFTVPEGFNIYEIADTLVKTKFISSKEDFLKVANNSEFTKSLGVNADRVEGFLFPETYSVDKTIGVEGVIKLMHSKYKEIFTEEFKSRAIELGFTEHEIITLASMIEKEAKVGNERKLISSVFHNRLKLGMKMQCDPTTIYGIWEKYDGVIRASHLKDHNPYNTYVVNGLPKGPIASPGKDSIEAALYPENTKYLFFVSRNDGSHFFTETYQKHRQLVNKYQR